MTTAPAPEPATTAEEQPEPEQLVNLAGDLMAPYKPLRAPTDLTARHPLFKVVMRAPHLDDALVERRLGADFDALANDLGRLPHVARTAAERARDRDAATRLEWVREAALPVADALDARARKMVAEAERRAARVRDYIPGALEAFRPSPTANAAERTSFNLRTQRIRDELAALPMGARMGRLVRAIPDDPLTLLAALDTSEADQLVPRELRPRLLREFAQARHPWLEAMQQESDYLAGAARLVARGTQIAVERMLAEHGIRR